MPITQPITVTGPQNTNFEPLPIDVYPFELIDIELVSDKAYQSEELVDKLKFEFACLDENLYGRRIWQRVTLKLVGGKKPSSLFTLITGLLGRSLTKTEMSDPSKFLTDTFLNSLIGKQVRLAIGQKESPTTPGKMSNKVDSYMPLKKSLPAFDKEKSKALGEAMKKEKPVPPEPQF